jgi:hypothetical protein
VKLVFGVLLLFVLILAVVYFGFWLWEFIESDSCLDLGGVWNYETSTCEQSPLYDEWRKRKSQNPG